MFDNHFDTHPRNFPSVPYFHSQKSHSSMPCDTLNTPYGTICGNTKFWSWTIRRRRSSSSRSCLVAAIAFVLHAAQRSAQGLPSELPGHLITTGHARFLWPGIVPAHSSRQNFYLHLRDFDDQQQVKDGVVKGLECRRRRLFGEAVHSNECSARRWRPASSISSQLNERDWKQRQTDSLHRLPTAARLKNGPQELKAPRATGSPMGCVGRPRFVQRSTIIGQSGNRLTTLR